MVSKGLSTGHIARHVFYTPDRSVPEKERQSPQQKAPSLRARGEEHLVWVERICIHNDHTANIFDKGIWTVLRVVETLTKETPPIPRN